MVIKCSVPGCRNESFPGCGISFHSFPKNEILKQQWRNAVPLRDVQYHHKVCSKHFKKTDFITRGASVRLNQNAVPSVAIKPEHAIEIISEIIMPSTSQNPSPAAVAHQSKEATNKLKRPLSELNVGEINVSESRSKIKKVERHTQTKISRENISDKRKIKILNQRIKRRDSTIKSLKSLLAVIKKKTNCYDDLKDIINDNFPIIHTKFAKKKKSNYGIRYSSEIKQFSLTLHYYSPRAYRFLRNYFSLPHPGTIRRMLSSSNCNVGFIEEVFSFLNRERNEKFNLDVAHVSLIFDAMSIKAALEYDKKSDKVWGYVDLGGIIPVDSNIMATEVLVFEIVSFTSRFKCCIGYFVTNKLSAPVQAQLILTAIRMLDDINITVHSLTCDGTIVNVNTFIELGCVFEIPTNVKTSFCHPNGKSDVHCIFDAPHMLKLARNALGDFDMISNNDKITYQFIKTLHNVQEQEGLHFANKLTSTHVNYQGKKMNVRLASQLLSNSVADSIDFLQASGNSSFQGSEGTVKFIRQFDRIFDVMNTKNPFGMGMKSPMSKSNQPFWENFFTESREYLLSLKIENQCVMQHRRKMFAMGFYIDTISFQNLAIDLLNLNENPMKYLLTYKCSQDHVEMLFSCIRARGGANNNPTALQFKHTLRKLMFKNSVTPSVNANCAYDGDFDCTPILDFRSVERSSENADTINETDENEINESVLSYMMHNINLSTYQKNIIYYISGFIVKKLLKKLTCKECQKLLIDKRNINVDHDYAVDVNSYSAFTAFINRGALCFPSRPVYQILKQAEKTFRQTDFDSLNYNIRRRLVLNIIQHFANDISTLLPHPLTQGITCEDLHETQLLKAISEAFVNIRCKYYFRLKTIKLSGSKTVTRQKLHKQILFNNL